MWMLHRSYLNSDCSKFQSLITRGRFSHQVINIAHCRLSRLHPHVVNFNQRSTTQLVTHSNVQGDVKQMCILFGAVWESHVQEAIDMGNGKKQKYIDTGMEYSQLGRTSNGLSIAFRTSMKCYGKSEGVRASTVAMDPGK